MDLNNLGVIGGSEVDLQDVIDSVTNELRSDADHSFYDAVRHGDDDAVRAYLNTARISTSAAKREAVLARRPSTLRALLEYDSAIDDTIVQVAGELRDRDCVRLLLDYGWPVNRSLAFGYSLLW